MAIRLTTASGSVYEVDGNRIRRVVRSPTSDSERVALEWRVADSVEWALDANMFIVWGIGPDQYSPEGCPQNTTRCTTTARVVKVETL